MAMSSESPTFICMWPACSCERFAAQVARQWRRRPEWPQSEQASGSGLPPEEWQRAGKRNNDVPELIELDPDYCSICSPSTVTVSSFLATLPLLPGGGPARGAAHIAA